MRKRHYRNRLLANRRKSLLARVLSETEEQAVELLVDEGVYDDEEEAIEGVKDGSVEIYEGMTPRDVAHRYMQEGYFTDEQLMRCVDYDLLLDEMQDMSYVVEGDGFTVVVN